MEVAGMKPDEEIISFTRNEWKHLLDEIEMNFPMHKQRTLSCETRPRGRTNQKRSSYHVQKF